MKDKEKQFKEMGKVMPEKIKDPLDNSRYIIFGKSLRREIARIYYNAGYRKIDKDTVVLSREEYIDLSRNYVGEQITQARKETAREILNDIIQALETKKASIIIHYGIAESVGADVAIRTVKGIAEQFGVEIKE